MYLTPVDISAQKVLNGHIPSFSHDSLSLRLCGSVFTYLNIRVLELEMREKNEKVLTRCPPKWDYCGIISWIMLYP